MFLSRKEKLAKFIKENNVYLKNKLDDIKNDVCKAEKISDLGARYLSFEKIKNNVQNFMTSVDERIEKQAKPSWETQRNITVPFLIGGMAGMFFGVFGLAAAHELALGSGALLVTVSAALIPVGIGLGLIGVGVGEILEKIQKGSKKTLRHSMSNMMEEVSVYKKTLLKDLTARQESLIKNEMPALSLSSRFSELYKNFPSIKEAFTREALKEKFTPAKRPQLNKLPHQSKPLLGKSKV